MMKTNALGAAVRKTVLPMFLSVVSLVGAVSATVVLAQDSETQVPQTSTEASGATGESAGTVPPRDSVVPGTGIRPPNRAKPVPRNVEFPGLRMGSFLVYPEISVAIMHDDNIYAEPADETSDYITIVSPLLAVESDWSKHQLNLEAGADIDRYDDFTQENVDDYWAGADGRLDLGRTLKVFGGVRGAHDHEDRGEPDALSPFVAAEPTVYDQLSADLGAALKLGAASIRLGGTFDQYDYQDVPSVAGPVINMDDRDRDMYSLGARLSLNISNNVDVFGQYASDTREYKYVPDDFGYQRDSEGYRAAAGLRMRNDRRTLVSEVYAGHMYQEYEDPRFQNLSKPYFGADALWRPTPRITFRAFIDRALEESTIPGVSGYLDTTYGLRAERKLTKDLTANGRFAYTLSEFEGSERVDKVIDAGAGLRYFVSRTVYLGADYRLIDRNSDDPIAQYARDQFMLSIGLTPGRSDTYALRPEAGESALQIDEPDDFGGLYIGATGAYGTFQTVTDGARGESGTDVGAMGDDGGTIGVFVGIGTSSDRWYIGVEAETETSNADWYHQKAKTTSRTATVEKHGGYGIGLRFGTILDQGQLVFLRAMGVRTEFHSYYTQNDLVLGAYDQHEEVSGLRVGVGADIPAGDNFFIRLEYAYTEYNAYDVAYLSTSGTSYEKFNNEENMARLGLGWLFGAHSAPEPYPVAEPISGFYAGAQVGPSTLETKLTGLHIDGGAPPPSSFTGEFSDQGWAPGAFFGYGFNVERWYFGAELEANTSDAVWEHVRESAGGGGGRDFSVAKKSDYGLSLRLGYSLRNATLVYMRVGAVNGRFNTTYEKGNNAAQYIARSDTLNGIRAGMGAEIPIGRTTFLRMDFTHTNYDSFSFVTAHGGGANADEMTFNNSENLFRFGLGFRF